jgi:integrase
MSIYKRKSGRWAVRIDVDQQPFRLFVELQSTSKGRRRTQTVGTFTSRAEAEKQKATLIKNGDARELFIEENARVQRALGTFRTKVEAERAENAAAFARDSGLNLAPGTVTVGDILAQYNAGREDLGRERKTTTEYQRQARLYIVPHLGRQLVAKLKPAQINAWLSTLMRSGGQGGRGLSAKTVNHAYRLLSGALRWAVRMELAVRNACESVIPPSIPKPTSRAFDNAEIVALINGAVGGRWEAFIVVALAVGARRAELLALNWADVHLLNGMLLISKAMCQITGSAPFVKGTKTGSRRSVPLAKIAIEALRKQHALQARERLAAGGAYRHDSSDPIFTNEIGERLTPQAATTAFKKLARRAGVSTGSLHSLRHSAATHLLASGVDIATTAGILGHANASVTLNVYGHVLGGGLRAGTDRLGERLERIRDAG